MKPVWIALMFGFAPLAMSQTMPQDPPSPLVQEPGSEQPLLQTPPQATPVPPGFKLEPGPKAGPKGAVPGPRTPWIHPKLDPQMIRRPTPGSFQQPEPRTPMAHSLYPDLELLPIETARLEAIPITWPGFRLETIPTRWPNARVASMAGAATAVPPHK